MSISGLGATYSALNGLTEQIAQSVKNIKAQSVKLPEYSAPQNTSQASDNAQPFTLNSYAVSYLSPNSLYSVHKIAAEQPEELPNRQQKQVLSNPDGQENTTQIEEGLSQALVLTKNLTKYSHRLIMLKFLPSIAKTLSSMHRMFRSCFKVLQFQKALPNMPLMLTNKPPS